MYRTVACLLCHLPATVKPTKTNRLVLRCDNCGMPLFANGEDAQERLSGLPDYNESDSYDSSLSGY